MKANDLQIGDWVTFEDCPKGEIVKIKIFGIHNEEECCAEIDDCSQGLDLLDVSDLAGIPLTPEILEKNGCEIYEQDFTGNTVYKFGDFNYMEYDGYYKYLDIGSKITYEHFGRKITFIRPLMRIKFVHELQHALRLCGIEKDITLKQQTLWQRYILTSSIARRLRAGSIKLRQKMVFPPLYWIGRSKG